MDFPIKKQDWVKTQLNKHALQVKTRDFSRPWGGFYVLEEDSLRNFVKAFFPELADKLHPAQPWSPKSYVSLHISAYRGSIIIADQRFGAS